MRKDFILPLLCHAGTTSVSVRKSLTFRTCYQNNIFSKQWLFNFIWKKQTTTIGAYHCLRLCDNRNIIIHVNAVLLGITQPFVIFILVLH